MAKMKNIALVLLVSICVSCRMFRDTEGYDIKSKHNSDNTVYTTNSKFTYSIERFKDKDKLDSYVINHLNDTLLIDKVALTILPGAFLGQTKLKWEYLNLNDSVVEKQITGLIEDSTTLWIHPPRSGFPMIYTESAPFPKVKFPLEKHTSWIGGIQSIKGYEQIGLEGRVDFQYSNSGKSSIKTINRFYSDCWKFESIGKSIIGSSLHTFYYDENDGFVHSSYEFPNGEKVILQLQKRIDPI